MVQFFASQCSNWTKSTLTADFWRFCTDFTIVTQKPEIYRIGFLCGTRKLGGPRCSRYQVEQRKAFISYIFTRN